MYSKWFSKGALLGGAAALLGLGGSAIADPGEAPAEAGTSLAPPVTVEAGGKVIDVPVGHAAPFVTDWNGDGKPDLLVGMFGGGQMRIYLNEGEPGAPRFGEGTLFEAGGAAASVPSG